jgi:hypothetical protein
MGKSLFNYSSYSHLEIGNFRVWHRVPPLSACRIPRTSTPSLVLAAQQITLGVVFLPRGTPSRAVVEPQPRCPPAGRPLRCHSGPRHSATAPLPPPPTISLLCSLQASPNPSKHLPRTPPSPTGTHGLALPSPSSDFELRQPRHRSLATTAHRHHLRLSYHHQSTCSEPNRMLVPFVCLPPRPYLAGGELTSTVEGMVVKAKFL